MNIELVNTSYKIVPKQETNVLIKTIKQCQKIYEASQVMYFDNEDEKNFTEQILNRQINRKLMKCYRYYARYYNITFDSNDNSEYNIDVICKTIKSWEE